MLRKLEPAKSALVDNMRFIRSWFDNPLGVGALSPSGRALAKAMASYVDLSSEGPIVELGPGTGPVTQALLARGIARHRLVLVEYERRFCKLLCERYPGVNVVQGDAYGLEATLSGRIDGKIAAVVSSLPLLNRPERDRIALLDQAFRLLSPEGAFIQFTYGLTSPIPIHSLPGGGAYIGQGSAPVLLNLPPARVWRYRRAVRQEREASP